MAAINDISVGVDLGSSSVTCVVVRHRDGVPTVIGVGQAAGTGLSQGNVVHIDATVEAIRQAVDEAAIMSSVKLISVHTTLAGAQLQGFNSHGMVEVPGREVRREDMRRVIDAARAVPTPETQRIIHVIPQEYVVDGQRGVFDPEGMSGVCLEAWVHLMTAPAASLEHTMQAFQRAGLKVEGVVVQQLAASAAVLTPDEKELGVCLVDLGGGTTKLSVFVDSALAHTAVFPLAGDHLTGDLAAALKTVREEAERLKQKYGVALACDVDPEEVVTLPAVGGRPPMDVSRQFIAEVLEARLEDILTLVYQELERNDLLDRLTGGVVLTGGTALLRGIETLAHEVLELPVRVGCPTGVRGLGPVINSPRFATAVGLALGPRTGGLDVSDLLERRGRVGQLWERTKSWFAEFF